MAGSVAHKTMANRQLVTNRLRSEVACSINDEMGEYLTDALSLSGLSLLTPLWRGVRDNSTDKLSVLDSVRQTFTDDRTFGMRNLYK